MSKKLSALLIVFIITIYFLFSLIVVNFDGIRNRYKEIEPNLDNYSAAEILILSFERMKTSLLVTDSNDLDDYFLKMSIFESKINILEKKSNATSSFYYNPDFIRIKSNLKEKLIKLRSLSEKTMSEGLNKPVLLSSIYDMENTLLDLQEVIYEIQIKKFDELKKITQDNSSTAEILAILSLVLIFFIFIILLKNSYSLKRVIKNKNLFISSIYHEIASSTQAIIIAADIIEHDSMGDNLKKEARLISNHVNKIVEQTREVMDYARLEMMKVTINKSAFSVNSLIQSAIDEVSGNNKIVFFKSSINIKIISDKYKIYRVVVNLLDNANKFTHQGTILVHTKIIAGRLFILVKDNGIGFDFRNLGYFFQAFNQGAKKETKQGLGLGLTIIKNYVESLSGKIRVRTKIGVGSSFFIFIPIDLIEE